MRGLHAPVVVVLAMTATVGCTTTRSPKNVKPLDGYVSLSTIGTRYGLAYTLEGNGTGVLTGRDNRVVVRDGLAVAIVNGERVTLSGPARVEGMEASVPTDAVEKIAAALSAAPPVDPCPSGAGNGKMGATVPPRKMTIVIDPGHGGKFPGARARNGLEEKTVTLDVSRRLRDALTRVGFKVLMTRESDRHVSDDYRDDLDARVRLAERSGADLFVSIHANASKDPDIVGFEIYRARVENRKEVELRQWGAISTARKKDAKSPAALYDLNRIRTAAFADELRRSMRSTGIPDRGVHEAGFHVLKWAPCPAVLIEMDYLSNWSGMQRLGNATMRQKIADALAGGIARFAGRLDQIGVK